MTRRERLRHAGLRARQTFAHFDNPVRLLATAALLRMRGGAGDLVFRRGTVEVATPLSTGAVFPVYEVFAEDTYKLDWLAEGLRTRPRVLDIGAHVGSFSLAFAQRVPDSEGAAYEASAHTARYLRRNLEASGVSGRVSCHAEAVSDVAGEIEFADNDRCSPLNAVSGRFGGRKVTVPSITMETAFQRLDHQVDVVKIDAEGAEYAMVLASDPELWRPVSRVVLEYHEVDGHDARELIEFFAKADLEVAAQEPMIGNPREGMLWLARGPRQPFPA